MTNQDIRNKAAELAREVRAIKRKGDWSIRAWNQQVRIAVRNYIKNTEHFLRANQP
jgi:hypothetical protein